MPTFIPIHAHVGCNNLQVMDPGVKYQRILPKRSSPFDVNQYLWVLLWAYRGCWSLSKVAYNRLVFSNIFIKISIHSGNACAFDKSDHNPFIAENYVAYGIWMHVYVDMYTICVSGYVIHIVEKLRKFTYDELFLDNERWVVKIKKVSSMLYVSNNRN